VVLVKHVQEEFAAHDAAERQLATAADWGRYAELFEFDAEERLLRLSETELTGTANNERAKQRDVSTDRSRLPLASGHK
jgi:AAA domain-containing protein